MASLSGVRVGVVGLSVGKKCTSVLRPAAGLLQFSKVGVLGTSPVTRHLTATHGEPFPRAKPWPYKTRPYNMFYEIFFDKTTKRLDENSRVIVVDGNTALGKDKLAQDIAREFDLLYVPSPKFDDIFTVQWSGFDIRELDEQMPKGARTWDLKRFNTDPEAKGSRVGMSQIYRYIYRVFYYTSAVSHMLNTGQGVVLVRSPFSDSVFADTMRQFDYFTPEGIKYYYFIRDNSICDILHPHLTIYLDAPVSMIQDRIKKRNIPYEVNSRVLTDKYLQAINDNYKQKLLPELRKSGEVLEYDLTEELDVEIVVEDMEKANLEGPTETYPHKFEEWNQMKEDEWGYIRKYYGNKNIVAKLFSRPVPWEAPELLIPEELGDQYRAILEDHPGYKYEAGYDPAKNSVVFRF